ncbi:MAG: type II toxin-antitoxin system RelE/ParE family toxin [Beijerinckiaceae bacterium]
MIDNAQTKPVIWVASTQREFRAFPDEVKSEMGYALFVAQRGGRHRKVKTLKGYGGGSVVEIVEDHDGEAFRAVYTVRFASVVYVLHAFQKKSKKGIATPQADLRLIDQRLRDAQRLHEEMNDDSQN